MVGGYGPGKGIIILTTSRPELLLEKYRLCPTCNCSLLALISVSFDLCISKNVSTMVMWESSQLLGKNIVWSTGQKKSIKRMSRCTGHRDITEIVLKKALNTIQSIY